MRARAYAVHHVRGRTRFRIPARRGDRAFFDEAASRLARLPEVRRIEANPTTGSVLIRHTGDLDTLLDAVLGSDAGELVQLVLGSPPVARQVRADIAAVDDALRRWSAGEFDLTTVAALGLIAMAGLQLIRGQQRSAVAAVSLAWYAAELMRRWPEPQHAEPAHH